MGHFALSNPDPDSEYESGSTDTIEFGSKTLVSTMHGLINYIDTKAKCRHLKKLTCKGTLRQVFIIVYRLELLSVIVVFLDPAL
jgi:hypothetical protein